MFVYVAFGMDINTFYVSRRRQHTFLNDSTDEESIIGENVEDLVSESDVASSGEEFIPKDDVVSSESNDEAFVFHVPSENNTDDNQTQYISKNGQIQWQATPLSDARGRGSVENIVRFTPGPTRLANRNVDSMAFHSNCLCPSQS